MNKLISRRVKRARRRGKYTTRKGYRKYRKHYTRKNVKRTQCQGKGRLRKQRQTRRKDGGADNLGQFNFVLPEDMSRGIEIKGQGWAYVTKLGSLFSQTKRPEQIIIYKKTDDNRTLIGNYFIARCTFSECGESKNMESKILETTNIGIDLTIKQPTELNQQKVVLRFTTTQKDIYRISFTDEDNLQCYKNNTWVPHDYHDKTLPAFYVRDIIQRPRPIVASTLRYYSPNSSQENNTDANNIMEAPAAAEANAAAEAKAAASAEVNLTNNYDPGVIKDMLKKAAGTGEISQQCAFFCKPDSCDADMLQKLKNKVDLIKEEDVPEFVALASILDDDSLLLILENLCVEYDKTANDPKKIDIFIESMNQCKSRLNMLFKQNDKLHDILRIFYNKCFRFISLDLDIKNLKLLLKLLNSMTHENMQQLLQLLNSMTPENMQQLLQLLNSMTPESILKLLTDLATINQEQIKGMLDTYNKLNPESMARLLELYSFIEKSQNGDEVLIHRYKGETPLSQRIYRTREHSPETCDSVTALHNQVMEILKERRLTIKEDEEFKKVLEECKKYHPQIVTGGGRKRRTLKKKRGGNSKR